MEKDIKPPSVEDHIASLEDALQQIEELLARLFAENDEKGVLIVSQRRAKIMEDLALLKSQKQAGPATELSKFFEKESEKADPVLIQGVIMQLEREIQDLEQRKILGSEKTLERLRAQLLIQQAQLERSHNQKNSRH